MQASFSIRMGLPIVLLGAREEGDGLVYGPGRVLVMNVPPMKHFW